MSVTKLQHRGALKVRELTVSDFQKRGTITAVLEQEVTTTAEYSGIQISNNMQDNMFSEEEFDSEPSTYDDTKTRVAFVSVPEGTTKEEVEGRLKPENCLYRVISNQPIFTDSQINAMSRGLITKEKLAAAQVVRYPDTHEKAKQMILDPAGNVQYRRVFFSKTTKEDQDLRDPNNVWMSKEIEAELALQTTGEIVIADQQLA